MAERAPPGVPTMPTLKNPRAKWVSVNGFEILDVNVREYCTTRM